MDDQAASSSRGSSSTPVAVVIAAAATAKSTRRRACDDCIRRRSRCDGLSPCTACQLYNTQDNCRRSGGNVGHAARDGCIEKSCQNCRTRKSKCDRQWPCSTCVRFGKQGTCYDERDNCLAASTTSSSSPSSTPSQTDSRRAPFSKRACFNCWHRKSKCDKQVPCASCQFHGSIDSCFVELDKDNRTTQQQRGNVRRAMMASRKKCAAAKVVTKRRSKCGGTSCVEAAGVAAPSCDKSATAVSEAMACLPSPSDVVEAFSLIGDISLANDWPTVDRKALRAIYRRLERPSLYGPPSAVELAYVHALLAVCSIALPLLHPFKLTGAYLHPSKAPSFVATATTLVCLASEPQSMTASPILECRVFHALAWASNYAGHSVDAHYYSEQSIFSARVADILDGFPDDDDKGDADDDDEDRNAVRDLLLEVSSLANWVSFAAGLPSSIPPLSPDARRYALAQRHNNSDDYDGLNELAARWRAWKVHSSGWMGEALRFLRQIAAKRQDGTPVMTSTECNACAMHLVKQMEHDERHLDACNSLLRLSSNTTTTTDTALDATPTLENAVQMRNTNAKLAAKFTTYILKDMLTSHALTSSDPLDIDLSRTALLSAQQVFANLPTLLSLFRSQYDFPPLRLFLTRMFESSMQTTWRALSRLNEVQNDVTTAAQMTWLIGVVPGMYAMMNSRGLAGPSSLAVVSMCQMVPIHWASLGQITSMPALAMNAHASENDDDEVDAIQAFSAVAASPTMTRIEEWERSVCMANPTTDAA